MNRYLTIRVRLQKQLSRKYGDKIYAKYVIVIRPTLIEKLGWEDKQELKPEIKNNKLIITKKDGH